MSALEGQALVLDALDRDEPERPLGHLARGPRAIWCPDLGSGRLVLPRHRECRQALRSPEMGCGDIVSELLRSLPPELAARLVPVTSWLLYCDPPDHDRLRTAISREFTGRRVEALRPLVEHIVDGLLDRLAESDGGDVVRELSYPLPVLTVAALLGLPATDRDDLKAWSDGLIRIVEPSHSEADLIGIASSWSELWHYFEEARQLRLRRPGDDLLSGLVSAQGRDAGLSTSEIISSCISLLLGGHETTTNLISSIVVALDRHVDQRAVLAVDPDVVVGFVEEVMRCDGPAKITARVTRADVDIDGTRVEAGTRIVLLLAAANRDPEAFSSPEVFMASRRPNPHLGFGVGIHACIGAALARLQGRVVVERVLRRFSQVNVLTSAVVWTQSRVLRSVARLPVEVRSR